MTETSFNYETAMPDCCDCFIKCTMTGYGTDQGSKHRIQEEGGHLGSGLAWSLPGQTTPLVFVMRGKSYVER